MLTIAIIDLTEKSRAQMLSSLEAVLRDKSSETSVYAARPELDLLAMSVEEFKVASHRASVVILGPEILDRSRDTINELKVGGSYIMMGYTDSSLPLDVLQELIELGIEDILKPSSFAPESLFAKLFSIQKKNAKEMHGKLILLAAGKGGMGVTTITALLGEALALEGHKVGLIDLDIDTRDLSTFLGVQSGYNETLEFILLGKKGLSPSAITGAFTKVLTSDSDLSILSPSLTLNSIYLNQAILKLFFDCIKVALEQFDYLLLDPGSMPENVMANLFHISDRTVLVSDNNPSSLHALISRYNGAKRRIRSSSKIDILLNRYDTSKVHGPALTTGYLLSQLQRTIDETALTFLSDGLIIPFSADGSSWPGSGCTMLGLSKRDLLKTASKIAANLAGKASKPKADKEPVLAIEYKKAPEIGVENVEKKIVSANLPPESKKIADGITSETDADYNNKRDKLVRFFTKFRKQEEEQARLIQEPQSKQPEEELFSEPQFK